MMEEIAEAEEREAEEARRNKQKGTQERCNSQQVESEVTIEDDEYDEFVS